MRQERTATNVIVSVVDLSDNLKRFLSQWREWHPGSDATAMTIYGASTWGFVETAKGRFYLCEEGVGHLVETGKGFDLDVGTEKVTEEGRSFSFFPVATLSLGWVEQLDLPVTKDVNLAEYIRRFGTRLECNYHEIRSYLEGSDA